VSRVGVEVDTAVENGRGILADGGRDECFSTRMILDEVGYIVNDTSNRDECLSVLRLSDEIIPANDRELLKGSTPVKGGSLLVELLLKLLDAAFLDLILTELLQIIGQTKLLASPDEPLGRIALPPLNRISVVRWEFVMELRHRLAI